MRVSSSLELVNRMHIHLGLIGFGRHIQLPLLKATRKIGLRFNRETIHRDVVRSQINSLLKTLCPFFRRLPRRAVHKIDTYILKPHIAGGLKRHYRIRCRVKSTECFECATCKCLHAQAQTIDAVFI